MAGALGSCRELKRAVFTLSKPIYLSWKRFLGGIRLTERFRSERCCYWAGTGSHRKAIEFRILPVFQSSEANTFVRTQFSFSNIHTNSSNNGLLVFPSRTFPATWKSNLYVSFVSLLYFLDWMISPHRSCQWNVSFYRTRRKNDDRKRFKKK